MISFLEKNHKLAWAITISIAVFIFYISSIEFPPPKGQGGFPLKSVLYHIVVFFTFQLFLLISLVNGKKRHLIPLALVIAILYGITDELHQFFVPGRATDPIDLIQNSIGIFSATIIYLAAPRKKHKNL